MQVIVNNMKQLEVVFLDMVQKFKEYGNKLLVLYDKPYRDKTKKQLGYFFGVINDAIKEYYIELGLMKRDDDADFIREELYDNCLFFEDMPFIFVRDYRTGQSRKMPKRISSMSIEEMSMFIDRCIFMIDNLKHFEGLVLHPSVRYTWIRNVTHEEMLSAKNSNLPREDRDYLAHTRKLACLWCGKVEGSEAHHMKKAGDTGAGYKSDDWFSVPLCMDCHIKGLHQHGVDDFYRDCEWITNHIDFEMFCRMRYLRWKNLKI